MACRVGNRLGQMRWKFKIDLRLVKNRRDDDSKTNFGSRRERFS